MQDRYAGDVGDFGKLALLRALQDAAERTGVCWYATAGATETNNDGRHVAFLDRPERFRSIDPDLFDALRRFRDAARSNAAQRTIASLERLELLPSRSRYHAVPVPRAAEARKRWAHEQRALVDDCDLVFLDPDNGLETGRPSVKSVALAELVALRRSGRTIVLYHHQTRAAGGASVEAQAVADRLRAAGVHRVDALRLRPYSARFYFVIDARASIVSRLVRFHSVWGDDAELTLDVGRPG